MEISMRAAPEGSRLPCSQLRRVLRPMPSKLANASWVRSSDCRPDLDDLALGPEGRRFKSCSRNHHKGLNLKGFGPFPVVDPVKD